MTSWSRFHVICGRNATDTPRAICLAASWWKTQSSELLSGQVLHIKDGLANDKRHVRANSHLYLFVMAIPLPSGDHPTAHFSLAPIPLSQHKQHFDLINVTLTNFGRELCTKNAQRTRECERKREWSEVEWSGWAGGREAMELPPMQSLPSLRQYHFQASLVAWYGRSAFPRNALAPLQYGLIIHAT